MTLPTIVDGHMARILGVVDMSDTLMSHLIRGCNPMDILYLEYSHDEGHLGLDEYGIPAGQLLDGEPDFIHRYRGDWWVKFWRGKTETDHHVIHYEAGESNQSAEIGTIWLSNYELAMGSGQFSADVRPWDIFPERYSKPT